MRGIRRLFLFSRSLFFGFFFFFDGSIDFYSRCCHFFSDLILATYTHTHTRTTKMPSDEQQLAEPLLDDGGNDRFVLFPLKYDAVWEMVRLSYDIISSIFKNLSVFEAFEICACADVLSSFSLSLPIINYSTRKLKRRSGPLVRFTSSSRSFLSLFFFSSSSSLLSLWTFQKLTFFFFP
mgnify:CR=1 FL=1